MEQYSRIDGNAITRFVGRGFLATLPPPARNDKLTSRARRELLTTRRQPQSTDNRQRIRRSRMQLYD